MNRFTRSIAMASARHPWRTIAGWVARPGGRVLPRRHRGRHLHRALRRPRDSQSARALDLLDESFPEAAKGKALVVFAAEDGETLDATERTSTRC